MRWLSNAICTSGEPVSPSTVAYSAMIFFLVSASVPIDTSEHPSLTRCAARRGLFTRALWIRGRLHGGRHPNGQLSKAISAGHADRIETVGVEGPLRRRG